MNAFPLTAMVFFAKPQPRRRRRTVADIQRAVATYYQIAPEHMVSPERYWSVSHPRQVAMYLAREITGMSLPGIGLRFGGRDHTTVLHAIRAVEARTVKDAELEDDLYLLRRALT